jgi:hypothetical protein
MKRFGKRRAWRLTEKQMDVLGHHDIADYIKLISDSHALECLLKRSIHRRKGKIGLLLIAAEGDEVQITRELIPFQALGHGGDCSAVIKNCKKHGRTVDRWNYPTLGAQNAPKMGHPRRWRVERV